MTTFDEDSPMKDPRDQGRVHDSMDRLSESLGTMFNRLEMLRLKLEPAMCPSNIITNQTLDTAKIVAGNLLGQDAIIRNEPSQLRSRLDGMVEDVSGAVDKINTMIAMLEI